MAHPALTGKPYLTRIVISSPGTAEQLSNVPIPDGFGPPTFKNRADNTGNFYLGLSAAAAQSSSGARKVLTPGESTSDWRVQNLNLVYVDADNGTDALEVTYILPA